MRLSKELRRYPRFDIQLPADIQLPDGKRYNGRTINISGNGLFFEHYNVSDITDNTQCTLTLYVGGNLYSEEIKFNGVLKTNRKNGVGIEFRTMSTNDFINFIFLLKREYPDPEYMISQFSANPGVQLLEEM